MSETTTPAEERLDWLVTAVQDPSGLTAEEIGAAFNVPAEWRDWSPERELDFLTNGPHAPSRPLTVERVTLGDEGDATALLVGVDGKRWSLSCWSEPDPPHRVTRARLMPAPPDGMTIRLATPDDAAELAALERRAPLRLGTDPLTFMTFDHGEDYFAPARLMEEVTTYVAELGGKLCGVYCGAVQPVQVDGERKRLFLEHHVRIDPDSPRGGVFWALCNFGRDRYAHTTDSIAFYVSVDNHALRKFTSGTPGWSVQPLRALLPCDAVADDVAIGDVAPATPADSSTIVEVLNGCHGDAPLFAPYTTDSLAARLGRDADQYGWADVAVLGGAVVGVGDALLRVTKECEGRVQTTTRALALDHGFLPGHEDDYRQLLRWWSRRVASLGATHLAVFTSERSPTFPVVSELAEEIERFDFWAFEIPEPPALADHGFYVDPVYF